MFPPPNCSLAESIASLSAAERAEVLAGLSDSQAAGLLYDWRGMWARPNQLPPPGNWRYWLVQAGRGFGKTRTGAETVREWVTQGYRRIHLVAPTASDARDVMVQGESGLMACFPPDQRPIYEPSKRLVTFANGATAHTFSADEPSRLRGPQCDAGWCDELAAWRFAEAWDNFLFGLRLGDNPRAVITTTPKPVKLIRDLVADPHTAVTRASTYENRANLAPAFLDSIIKKYENTRIGRQELLAELLEDIPGALWTRAVIDAYRIRYEEIKWELLVRVVVAIDPAVTAGEESDETGIIVAALTVSGHVVVLDDLSCRESPLGWARVAVAAYKNRRADRIVGEVNNGGDLVESNIRTIEPNVAYRAVRATRGKSLRAEPVAALYEQGRVHHAGKLDHLEDQMCGWVPGSGEKSPDRMDALVWAITDLLIDCEPVSVAQVWSAADYQISPI